MFWVLSLLLGLRILYMSDVLGVLYIGFGNTQDTTVARSSRSRNKRTKYTIAILILLSILCYESLLNYL